MFGVFKVRYYGVHSKTILGCAKNVEGLDCEFLCLDVRDIVEIRNIVVDTL